LLILSADGTDRRIESGIRGKNHPELTENFIKPQKQLQHTRGN